MDGNGRWAQQRGLNRVEGHRAGVDSVKTVIKCCLEKGVAILSLFAFSSENWSRPEPEIDFLMQLFIKALHEEVAELHENGIRLSFLGDRSYLSDELRKQMQRAEELTAGNDRLLLNIAVNYGGRWDIVQAVQSIADEVACGRLDKEAINERLVSNYLNTGKLPDPDLFIRTSGEFRISNFFLWQLAYTELYFPSISWPEFSREEFEKAIDSFKQRQRRYGKTSEQVSGDA
ncbi:undecaprenyl pyrophosphate synthase [Legionella birminghamensis]|uniref:Ditrans,polycis-undecaprenyl-diphosphate synthase ((2E,6E)-farnesyl-diphosphate specific) n=2 Tax=Legionella birminghamensis TaxID=28083 RepID=A0A378ID75_9GAMM|nr:undecaprenyl pyrophosphate synthase [Legionella birminghamensis]STX32692.1 undecaprenyl pyrophosphate synthetase [Legionella birminghamensis]